MKELLLSNPLIPPLLIVIGLIYLFLIFHFVGKDKKLSANVEKIIILLFLFITSATTGLTIVPFNRLNLNVLVDEHTPLPLFAAGVGVYLSSIILLSSRLRHTLKDLLYVFSMVIQKEPFLCLLLLMASLSACWSETPIFTLRSTIPVLLVSLFAIYIGKQYSWKELHFFLRWSCLLVLVFSLFRPGAGPGGNWTGILYHKNAFSYLMVQTVIWWLLQAAYVPKYRRRSIVVALLGFFAMQKGGSGASKVIFVILIGLWGYLGVLKKMKPNWAFISVILFMIISIVLSIWVSENIEYILVDTLNKDMTWSGRTEFWPLLMKKIEGNPWLGYGVGGFWQPWRGVYNPAYDIVIPGNSFRPSFSHNGFIELGLALGFTGIFLFFLSFFNNVAKAVQYLSQNKPPEAGLPLLLSTYTLIVNISESHLLGGSSFWFWYVVLTVRLILDTRGNVLHNQRQLQQVETSTAYVATQENT
jgi:O-antigen ligase